MKDIFNRTYRIIMQDAKYNKFKTKKVIKEDSDGELSADDLKWVDDTHFEASACKTFDDQSYNGHLYCSFSGEVKTAEDGSTVVTWESDVHSDAMDENLDIEIDGKINEGEVGCNGDDPKDVAQKIYERWLEEVDSIDLDDYAPDSDQDEEDDEYYGERPY